MANNQIALLAQMPVFDTPLESQGKALQLRQLMNQGAVQDMDMAQRRQAIADDAGARNVFATESDPAARIQALYKINPKAAQAFEKAQADISKDRASTGETEAKTRNENLKAINMRMQQARDLLGNVNDKQAAATWVQGLYSDPDIGKFLTQHVGPVEQALARIPDPQADPQGFAKWRRASQLSAEKLVETTMPKVGTRDLGGQVQSTLTDPITGLVTVTGSSAKTQTPDSIATNATQRRGQNMADERAKEANQNSRGVIIQTDTGPMLANTRTGGTQQIIGPDGKPVTRTKPLTEFQGKSAAFGDRAMAADKILGELGTNYSPAAINSKNAVEGVPLVGGAMGAITNKFALSENDQRAEQAQRDFINAVLRQESGAAIGANEFDNARKQYFPQPGDGPKVLAQKAANRKLVIEGFKRSAGANAEFTPAGDNSQPNSLPTGWSVEVH